VHNWLEPSGDIASLEERDNVKTSQATPAKESFTTGDVQDCFQLSPCVDKLASIYSVSGVNEVKDFNSIQTFK